MLLRSSQLGALTVNVDIPDFSNALSKFLLTLPEMIREAEGLSRKRREQLLAAIVKQLPRLGSPSRPTGPRPGSLCWGRHACPLIRCQSARVGSQAMFINLPGGIPCDVGFYLSRA
jgi:hypothetical protein